MKNKIIKTVHLTIADQTLEPKYKIMFYHDHYATSL